jgi:hypothetical protein
MMKLQLFVASFLAIVGTHTHAAALMGFEDSAMLMMEANRYNQEMMLNYSPKVGHAFGIEYMRMHGEDDTPMTMTMLNYTGLVKRWNLPAAQANIWFTGGLGEAHGRDASGLAYTPSIQFDAESTRLYFLAKARMIRADGVNFDTAALQAGFSFYEAGFDETQPWFVLEAKTMRHFSPSLQVTPALRLINKNYFLELGVTNPFDNTRASRLNLMFTF